MQPILFLRNLTDDAVELAALTIDAAGAAPQLLEAGGESVAAKALATRMGRTIHRYIFTLPQSPDAEYRLGGERYKVDTHYTGDLRIAYVSCNGQEHDDRMRAEDERNRMWARLGEQHEGAPFHLLLHGGDQIYADEVTNAHPATRNWPKDVPATLSPEEREALYEKLCDAFFERYAEQYQHRDFAAVVASVPSLAMWDDHDICDGWGSLDTAALDSDTGRTLFAAAREMFLLFQCAARSDDLPPLLCDRTGTSLSFAIDLPGVTLIAPDLRSERRPHRIMGETGWRTLTAALEAAGQGKVLLMSSVPALGPRLSLLEKIIPFIPKLRKYKDDLLDQWQSGTHRSEWTRFLTAIVATHERQGRSLTVLSGEIHLATHATLGCQNGDLHQLVASGITHTAPPRAYARGLGVFASLGASPLPAHPITIRGLPGQNQRYTAERNFLVLERRGEAWHAAWELEESGRTQELAL
ncbi:MAG: alkaline phosphatase D family protein [Pseudomonadota bacterium]